MSLNHIHPIRFSPDMFAAIKAAATKDGRSVGDWIRRSVQGSLDAAHYADPKNRRITGPAVRRTVIATTTTGNSAFLDGRIKNEPFVVTH